MTPTRDRLLVGLQLDTGVGSPPTERPNVWEPAIQGGPVVDTGTGSPQAPRLTLQSDAFVPPWWSL